MSPIHRVQVRFYPQPNGSQVKADFAMPSKMNSLLMRVSGESSKDVSCAKLPESFKMPSSFAKANRPFVRFVPRVAFDAQFHALLSTYSRLPANTGRAVCDRIDSAKLREALRKLLAVYLLPAPTHPALLVVCFLRMLDPSQPSFPF